EGWFTDNTAERFRSYGWQVITNVDGHNPAEIAAAIDNARKNLEQPTLICCKTVIGFGSPNKQGKEECHGAALGDEEIRLTKAALDWQHGPFEVPDTSRQAWDARSAGTSLEADWQDRFAAYAKAFPDLAGEFTRLQQGRLPDHFDASADAFIAKCQSERANIA